MAFVDDGLEPLLEGVTRLQRSGDRDQQIRQLVLEGLQPLPHLEPNPGGRNQAGRHRQHHEDDRRCSEEKSEKSHQHPCADSDPHELHRSKLDIRALQHAADRPPLLQVTQSLLGGGEHR